jgi:NitT/TauT family transport system permease protein
MTTGQFTGTETLDSPEVAAELAGVPRYATRARRLVLGVVPPLVAFAFFMGVWYFVTYVVLSADRRFLLPPPHDVVKNGFFNGTNLHQQLSALWDTTKVAAVGLAIAFGLGTLIALVMSLGQWLERALYPYAVIVQVTPILAIVPLIALWFGYDFRARVVVCVMISIFPIITNTLHGLLTVDSSLHDLFKLHHAGRVKRLLKLQVPHAIPDIFVGLRVSAGLSVIGAIVGEFFFRQGTPGLGRLLDFYRAYLQSDLLMSTLVFCCLLGIAAFWGVGFIGRQLTKGWYEEGHQ